MATTKLDPPPIQHPIADKGNNWLTPQVWALWFGKLFGDGTGVNTPSFGVISSQGLDDVDATQPGDTLTLVAGANITLATNALAKSVTINSTGGQPAPPDTSVQFNDAGAFGGNESFEFKKTVTSVTIGLLHDVGTTGSANLLVGEGHTVL